MVTALQAHRLYLRVFGCPHAGRSVSEALFDLEWKLGREELARALMVEPDEPVESPAEFILKNHPYSIAIPEQVW
jgi:hypothetical protein